MKKIKIILILTLALLTVFSLASISYADPMKPMSIETVMSEIRKELGIADSEKIDPSKVSQAMLEKLGDSVMETMIGNTAMHDQMDFNLGGDGSAALTAFHVKLGLNYLSDYPNGMMNLMSGGMMRNNNTYPASGWNMNGMMGSFGYAGIIMGIIVTILIVIIALLVRKILRPKKTTVINETSLEILGRRYASGEITKDEFDKMTRNINSLK